MFSLAVKKAISRCVEVFEQRTIYPAHIIDEMKTALGWTLILRTPKNLNFSVSRIATERVEEKDEAQGAGEIEFPQLIRAIESFYKNEVLTEKARDILSRSSFNFNESVQARVKGFFLFFKL